MDSKPNNTPEGLKALQDQIYRQKVLRARSMTCAQRLAEVFELTNAAFARMHAGAMWQMGLSDPAEGWKVVSERLDRLRRIEEQGRYVTSKPSRTT